MKVLVRPFVGVGDIEFGMSKDECDSFLEGDGDTFLRVHGKPESAVTDYEADGLFLSFDGDGGLKFVEVYGPSAIFSNVHLMGRPLQEVVEALRASGVDGSPNDVGFMFPAHGFRLYAPNGKVEGVAVYRRGYYD